MSRWDEDGIIRVSYAPDGELKVSYVKDGRYDGDEENNMGFGGIIGCGNWQWDSAIFISEERRQSAR